MLTARKIFHAPVRRNFFSGGDFTIQPEYTTFAILFIFHSSAASQNRKAMVKTLPYIDTKIHSNTNFISSFFFDKEDICRKILTLVVFLPNSKIMASKWFPEIICACYEHFYWMSKHCPVKWKAWMVFMTTWKEKIDIYRGPVWKLKRWNYRSIWSMM